MWLLLTSRWRRRLGTQLVLAATIALAGGAVLACVAGARRTASADDRFISEAKMPDAAIDLEPLDGLSIDAQIAAITKLPQVAGSAHVANFAVTPTATSEEYQVFFAPLDDGLGVDVMKPRYVEGRAPEAADEISMDENRAELIGLELGDTVPAVSFTPTDVETLFANEGRMGEPPGGPPLELRLVGIERTPASIASDLDIASITTASRAFTETYGDEIGMLGELLFVDLEPGDGVDKQFAREVQDILGSPQAIEGGGEGTGSVASTVGFVARSLAIVAAIMAIAGLVAIFAVMLRLSSAGQDEHEVLGRDRRWSVGAPKCERAGSGTGGDRRRARRGRRRRIRLSAVSVRARRSRRTTPRLRPRSARARRRRRRARSRRARPGRPRVAH